MGRRVGGRASGSGLLVTAGVAIVLAVGFDLSAIASIGSVIALLVFGLVSVGHLRVRAETGAKAWILVLAVASTVIVLVSFVFTTLVDEPGTAIALVVILALCVAIDALWKRARARRDGRLIEVIDASRDDVPVVAGHPRSGDSHVASRGDLVGGEQMTPIDPTDVATDLVEYIVVLVSGPDALAIVGPELMRIVETSAIRSSTSPSCRWTRPVRRRWSSSPAIEGFDDVRAAMACYGPLLSRHDIDLVALALAPGDCAIVVVAEDLWAKPLALAARTVGGEVRAGERIARGRVEAALARVARIPKEQ